MPLCLRGFGVMRPSVRNCPSFGCPRVLPVRPACVPWAYPSVFRGPNWPFCRRDWRLLRDRFPLAIRVSSRRSRDLVGHLPTVEQRPPKNTREQEVPAWEARYTLDSDDRAHPAGRGWQVGCALARSPIVLSGFRRVVGSW